MASHRSQAARGLAAWWSRRRSRVAERTLQVWLDAHLPWRALLSAPQRERHLTHTQQLLQRLHLHGCDGLELSPRMAAVLCGLAALLCLRARRPMPQLRALLVYPAPFWVPQDFPDEAGLVSDEEVLHSGLSEDNGRVLLAWDEVEAALTGAEHNVAVHEFAHQLDAMSGGEGAPVGAPAQSWSDTMQAAWADFEQAASPVLDDYALEGPAEFFAVAVEAFFQRAEALDAAHPALYRLLAEYFGFSAKGLVFPSALP
ncbi:MAG: zinc-dependent peptidase [Algiphilus sp.]